MKPVDPEILQRMGAVIDHRGPDDGGVFSAPGIGLLSRRLAILDLSPNGHMPMSSPDGRYTMVYNGEVYNYKALKEDLLREGDSFRSNTDTEVVLRLYATLGPAMLSQLNGMFAIAIWDHHDRTLFLARDRLGVKPLYIVTSAGSLMFASEEKALFAAGWPLAIDTESSGELACFRYVAGEQTPFAGVRRLLPGHYMLWKDGVGQKVPWWSLADVAAAAQESWHTSPAESTTAWFRGAFDDSVKLRMISDVPLGVLLSGGLDSSSVAASLHHHEAGRVNSFTVRFSDPRYDEGPTALRLAGRLGLDHHELRVGEFELLDRLEEAVWFNDEPLAHASDPHLMAIAKFAKPHVTVLLSGEGSDEQMAGYVRYRPFRHPHLLHLFGGLAVFGPLAHRVGPSRVSKLLDQLALPSIDEMLLFGPAPVSHRSLHRLGIRTYGELGFRRRKIREGAALYPGDRLRQAMYYDLHTFLCSLLDRNDRMTMAASVECRVPFLDFRIVEGLLRLPTHELFRGTQGKLPLREAFRSRLGDEILSGRKWGFGVPWHKYLRTDPALRTTLSRIERSPLIDEMGINASHCRILVRDYLGGDDREGAIAVQLVMLALWRDTYWKQTAGRLGTAGWLDD
jgi:asparagine synthase (glutamine-hydrolysing)